MQWIVDEIKAYYPWLKRKLVFPSQKLPLGEHCMCDIKACSDCENEGRRLCDVKGNLMLSTHMPLVFGVLDQFFQQFNGLNQIKVPKSCDYIIEDEVGEKIVLCEMTCREEQYLDEYDSPREGHKSGKRADAYNQIQCALNFLVTIPAIQQKLLNYSERIGLFAWRDKTDYATMNPDIAERGIIAFLEPEKGIEKYGFSSDMGSGFKFVIVKYPIVYKW